MSLPIICFDFNGYSEVVRNGFNGIVIKKRNVNQMEKAIRFLINDDNLRKKMGNNSRKLALNKFSVDDVVKSHDKIYQKYIS